MTTISNIVKDIKTGLSFVKEIDKVSGKAILEGCGGNKTIANVVLVGSYIAGVALNQYVIHQLKRKGWNRTAKVLNITNTIGMVTTTPRLLVMLEAIDE